MFSATIYTHCWILKAIRNDAGMQKIAKIPVLYSQPHRGSCIKPNVGNKWVNESSRNGEALLLWFYRKMLKKYPAGKCQIFSIPSGQHK